MASPLTIVAAIVAIAFLGNTLSQFSRAQPSTGGFITFVGKSFGGTSAVATALVAGLGYVIAMSSVIAISGGFPARAGFVLRQAHQRQLSRLGECRVPVARLPQEVLLEGHLGQM